ncbi:MAG: hypothetical protein Q7W30_04290 [Coriobacteriia bacterium]|nr:hypothetical protein [Coriobacteriia bacterium]
MDPLNIVILVSGASYIIGMYVLRWRKVPESRAIPILCWMTASIWLIAGIAGIVPLRTGCVVGLPIAGVGALWVYITRTGRSG